MIKAIERALAPPVFDGDEEKTRRAGLLNLVVLFSLAITWLSILALLLGDKFRTPTLIIGIAWWLLLWQSRRWLHSGKLRIVEWILSIVFFVMITAADISQGSVRSTTTFLYLFWVTLVVMLYRKPGLLVATCAGSLAVLGLIWAENAGLLPKADLGVGVRQWMALTSFFAMTAGLTYYRDQIKHRALVRAENEVRIRTKLEAVLRDSEQRYRNLVEWTPEAIVVYDKDVIRYVNPAAVEMLGASAASDLVGSSRRHWLYPAERSVALAPGVSPPKPESTPLLPRFEQKLVKLDGTGIDVEFIIRTIDYNGEPARQAALRDITERKAIGAALEAARRNAENANREKSRFLAAASHDLRQPAHALGMFVARLTDVSCDPQSRQLVEGAQASMRAMQDLLDSFFDISRLDSDQTQISRVAFPIEGLFAQLDDSFAKAASVKGLRLRFRPSTAWVESDPGLLHRILINLVGNAVKYTERGSILVACRVARDPTQLRIEVRDSGIGIDAQHHEDIFQEFFQVENPHRDRAMGMGLGLSIVKRASRLLNHSLVLRSSLGGGTCFTLTVPLAPPRVTGTYEKARERAAKVDFTGLRVLLIEDDALGRAGLAALLTSWGCRVTETDGAKAACESYRPDQAPEIIISDFRLGGGINGIEAIDRLRSVAGMPIAAFLISGDTDAQLRQQAQAAELSLQQKPVRPAKLRNLIRHLAPPRPPAPSPS